MITADLHNHTHHSHAKDTVAAMAASAFEKGLKTIGFSEHSLRPNGYAYPNDYQPRLAMGFPLYIKEVLEAKEAYAGRMEVLLALEMDYMPTEEAYARKAVCAYSYEYIIGGLHFQGHWGFDFAKADWEALSETTRGEYFVRYYRDLASMARTKLFQTAAHPDLVKLFCKESFDTWLQNKDARDVIREALGAFRDSGMAMEVSSASIRKGLSEPYPGPVVMGMARDLGVPIVFGSDAHNVADVASHFDLLASYAQHFGYTDSAVFRKRAMTLQPFI